MIPVTQTKVVVNKTTGENVVRGNCYAAAIASILELTIDEVPNVETLFHIEGSYWAEVMHTWLTSKGYEIVTNNKFKVFHEDLWGNETPSLRKDAIIYCTDKFYLISGDSPRGVKHITIWKNGVMVFDPHPTREGILSYDIFEEIIPIDN